jgi:hypothetical protein
MVPRRVRDDAALPDGLQAEAFDQPEQRVVRAAGFEGADLLEVFCLEEEGEGGGLRFMGEGRVG